VCGLKWSPDGTTLASGGNENRLCLWDGHMSRSGTTGTPRCTLTDHLAAVKALAWSPHQRRILASGGGTADRCIKLWNANLAPVNSLMNSIDTGSQVCALSWSKHRKELVSSHGFSENQLCLWKYPYLEKIREFKGHTARVLHLDQSPDGNTIVSAAADETLRLWDILGPNSIKPAGKSTHSASSTVTGPDAFIDQNQYPSIYSAYKNDEKIEDSKERFDQIGKKHKDRQNNKTNDLSAEFRNYNFDSDSTLNGNNFSLR